MIDFGTRGHSIKSNEQELLGIDYSDELKEVLDDSLVDLVEGERLDFIFQKAAALLYEGMVTLMH